MREHQPQRHRPLAVSVLTTLLVGSMGAGFACARGEPGSTPASSPTTDTDRPDTTVVPAAVPGTDTVDAPAADSTGGELPFRLPDRPPDSTALDMRENMDSTWLAPRDVFGITFRPGLTRERKTRLVVDAGAIALVGGLPFSSMLDMDGMYFLRIRSDGTMTPLLDAVDSLNASPSRRSCSCRSPAAKAADHTERAPTAPTP